LVAGDYIINGEEITLEEDTDFYTPEKLYNATMAAAGYTDGYEADPWQAAYYLQDKMEWEGMIVNAGLRFDFWYLGEKYKIFKDTGDVYKHFDNDDRMQLMVSPRLGISHPISENSVVHFAYNYQNQLPEMQYIFTSTEAEDAITNQNQNIIIGNPTLEPQITATYEVGWQHQFGEDYVMDITAYYKNIYNYVSTEKVYLQDDGSLIPYSEVQASDNPDQYDTTTELYKYITQDYGSARGIDFNLSKMLSNFISGSMAYSLSWAEGNNSDTVVQDEATNLREFPLDWDTRHNFNFNFNFNIGRGEEFFIPFTDVILPLDNFKINFLYNISSGKPYTPQDQEGNPLEVNSERYPHTEKADLKIVKTFNLNDNTYFKVYADIQNLFNRRNIYYVYPRTGNAYDDGVDLTETNTNYIPEARQYIHDLSTDNPYNYSSGRTLTFGMSFHW
jgi:outer membrane receptor protein involved in Fe transport